MQLFPYVTHRINICGLKAVEEFFGPIFFQRNQELLLVGFVDQYGMLAELMVIEGTLHNVEAPVRSIISKAVTLDAKGLVLGHNHPSGICKPSRTDKAFTRALAMALEALEVVLLDHVIFSDGNTYSMRRNGLL